MGALVMEELLEALRSRNSAEINKWAIALLVTRHNRLNRSQAQEFERYAPCKITEWSSDIFKSKPYVGIISYGNSEYGFG